MNPFYNASGNPPASTLGRSAPIRAELEAIEAGFDLVAPLDSPNLTGTPTAPTPSVSDNTTKIATMAAVQAVLGAGGALLPPQATHAGKSLKTNGTSAAWESTIPSQSGHAGKFLKTDGSAESWQYVDRLLHVIDQKSNGTAGGTASIGSQTRTLNTVVTNEITGASLATNEITLPAGTYRILAFAPGAGGSRHKASLYNVTDAATVLVGTGAHVSAGNSAHSVIAGQFTLAGTKALRIDHYFTATESMGVATSSGQVEVYTVVMIWKVQ